MRILLDECVHRGVKAAFPEHHVTTVSEMGWRSTPDKKLLVLANGVCDVFVTVDAGFQHEQNLSKLSFGVLLIRVPNNKLESYKPLFDEMKAALASCRPGILVTVGGE